MIRALIGAICGAALGIAFLVALGLLFQVDSLWPVIFVGAITGLCMRKIASGGKGLYVKGALAALAMLAAVICGKLALAAVLRGAEPTRSVATVGDGQSPAGAEGPSSGSTERGPLEPSDRGRIGNPAPGGLVGRPRRGDFSLLDGIWLAVGALIAYELGREKPSKAKPDAAPDADQGPPADETIA